MILIHVSLVWRFIARWRIYQKIKINFRNSSPFFPGISRAQYAFSKADSYFTHGKITQFGDSTFVHANNDLLA